MPDYRVEWSTYLTAENAADAVQQAWGQIEDAVRNREGATGLFVFDEDGNKGLVDIEYQGFCDEEGCGVIYYKADRQDHCPECGTCWTHCRHNDEHYADSVMEQYQMEGR